MITTKGDMSSMSDVKAYDYNLIPPGYYDNIYRTGHPIRRAWHIEKFERVLDCLPQSPRQTILDIGCFAGTFLSLLPEQWFSGQVGVDILADQIEYSQKTFARSFRSFKHIAALSQLNRIEGNFDCVTMIEVIEHLTIEEIRTCFTQIATLLKPGGTLVFSTPNYTSCWPLLELILNQASDISYEEQHITKFNYFNLLSKLRKIYPKLDEQFTVEFKTSTHFISPFLAIFGVSFAQRVARFVPHKSWRFPFGNLVVVGLKRKTL